MNSIDSKVQARVAASVAAARLELETRMDAMGLTRAGGWSILERVIDSRGGSVWTFLPVHAKGELPPDGLGASISIDGDGRIRE